MTLDLTARRVIVASALYYGLDTPMMPDAEYDALTVQLADNWDDLDGVRKWQLGSARAIRASGNHVKLTQLAQGGVLGWLYLHLRERLVHMAPDRLDPALGPGLRYRLPADFRWAS